MHFRLLTVIIFACITLLIVKVADLIHREQSFVEAFFIATSLAEEDGDEPDSTKKEKSKEKKDVENSGSSENIVNDKPEFSQTEIDILQRLSRRREKLEEWQKDLEVKESILNITQTKIDQKIAELRQLKMEVEIILEKYNKKEDGKIKSLVKIYESMKPQNAAQIFAELDMETLLQVFSKMKEAKVALILAKMQPKKAKELTVNFAELNSLNKKQ